MTDEQVLSIYEKMQEYYGDKLPNPEHEPKQFEYCVKMMKYYEPEVFGQV